MADWNVTLPDEAEVGADTHVQDHNTLVNAVREVRTNLDEIELTPGPPGDDADPQFTSDEVTKIKALIADQSPDE